MDNNDARPPTHVWSTLLYSRGFSVTDVEGNIWSFGTYAGEPT